MKKHKRYLVKCFSHYNESQRGVMLLSKYLLGSTDERKPYWFGTMTDFDFGVNYLFKSHLMCDYNGHNNNNNSNKHLESFMSSLD